MPARSSRLTLVMQHAANPEMHKAMLGKRSSNAAGAHEDKRTKRKRTRAAKKQAAIKEQ